MSGISIAIDQIERFGEGLNRPEGVMCAIDGAVWTVDGGGACVRIDAAGETARIGELGGKPNGICIDRDGLIVVANIGGGCVQRLFPDGRHELIADAMDDGRPLTTPNFPFVDSTGRIWVTNSTVRADYRAALKDPQPDGTLAVIEDGRCRAVAEGLWFANGVAIDSEEAHVYVAESQARRVVRYAIRDDGSLDEAEPYGPELGEHGHPDGIAFDQAGNLWVTLPTLNGLGVIGVERDWQIVVEDSEGSVLRRPTNICFGGEELRTAYVGSLRGSWLARFRVEVGGMPLVHQL